MKMPIALALVAFMLGACTTRQTKLVSSHALVTDLRFEGKALAKTRCQLVITQETDRTGQGLAIALIPLCIVSVGRACVVPGKPNTWIATEMKGCTSTRTDLPGAS